MLGRFIDEGLGDLICTGAEMEAGTAAFGKMQSMWLSLGTPAQYLPAIAAIVAESKPLLAKNAAFYLPTDLCAWKRIGIESEALTKQMAADAHVTAPTHDTELDPGLSQRAGDVAKNIGSDVMDILKLAALGVGGYFVYKAVKK